MIIVNIKLHLTHEFSAMVKVSGITASVVLFFTLYNLHINLLLSVVFFNTIEGVFVHAFWAVRYPGLHLGAWWGLIEA